MRTFVLISMRTFVVIQMRKLLVISMRTLVVIFNPSNHIKTPAKFWKFRILHVIEQRGLTIEDLDLEIDFPGSKNTWKTNKSQKRFFSWSCTAFVVFQNLGGQAVEFARFLQRKRKIAQLKKRFFPEAVPFLWLPRIWGVRQWNFLIKVGPSNQIHMNLCPNFEFPCSSLQEWAKRIEKLASAPPSLVGRVGGRQVHSSTLYLRGPKVVSRWKIGQAPTVERSPCLE